MNTQTILHLLSGNELSAKAITHLLTLAAEVKHEPLRYHSLLAHKHIALLFDKPSLRTRMSFITAIHRLGGHAIESHAHTRKTEAPKDLIRVLQNYCDGIMFRTHDDHILHEMCEYAEIPVINGLSKLYHPCQTLADLFTLQQYFGHLSGLRIAYIGDGNNVLHSLLLMTNKLNITVHYCCPSAYQPSPQVLALLSNPQLVRAYTSPTQAVNDCDAVYTDVWTSMGCAQHDETMFEGYQVNHALMNNAAPNAIFMHCMPMERGKEVSDALADDPRSVIFQQSANRLYVQQAWLIQLFKPNVELN
ncbi:MAG: ornithine carbamoyltransferase [Gammaproteobacteria bacterium]